MPRPSLKAERREQILDAYATCVARHGVDGATLERVAEEAGLARALIRHNVGNREDLLEALVSRLLERTAEDMADLTSMLPATDRGRTLVRWLFDASGVDRNEALVGSALIMAASHDPTLAAAMRRWVELFETSLLRVLEGENPSADPAVLNAVVAGVGGLYMNSETAAMLGDTETVWKRSEAAAMLLIDALSP